MNKILLVLSVILIIFSLVCLVITIAHCADSFTTHAQRVVSGEIAAPEWKVKAYQRWLDGNARRLTAKVTTYCDRCDNSGQTAAGGKPYVGICAANPEIPFNTIIWVDGWGLLKVRDRGGAVKLSYCRNGDGANIDVYAGRRCPQGCNGGTRRNCPIVILR